MRSFPSSDITRRSGELLEQAERGPVSITRYNRPRYVVMTADHYERLARQNPRTAHGLDDVDAEMRADMLMAIDRELARD